MKMIIPVLKSWLPLATSVTLVCGIIYGTVQQTYRSNANDPQNQMAENAVTLLSHGGDIKTLVTTSPTEISTSLKPFLIIYDEHGNPIGSDAVLDGKVPVMPNGVLDYTQSHGSNAITWQPRHSVRSAIVILPVQNSFKGFVVAGRSLRLVEERESMLIRMIAFGWLVSLVTLLIIIAGIQFLFKGRVSYENVEHQ